MNVYDDMDVSVLSDVDITCARGVSTTVGCVCDGQNMQKSIPSTSHAALMRGPRGFASAALLFPLLELFSDLLFVLTDISAKVAARNEVKVVLVSTRPWTQVYTKNFENIHSERLTSVQKTA